MRVYICTDPCSLAVSLHSFRLFIVHANLSKHKLCANRSMITAEKLLKIIMVCKLTLALTLCFIVTVIYCVGT